MKEQSNTILCNDINKCGCIETIVNILSIYQKWCINRNQQNINGIGFYDIINSKLKLYNHISLYNDYFHIIESHTNNELNFLLLIDYLYNKINKFSLIKCEYKKCDCLRRNYRVRSKYGINNYSRKSIYFGFDDTKQISSIQICDIIHSYLLHSFIKTK